MRRKSWAILATLLLAACGHARAGWGVAWTFSGPGGIATNGSVYNNPASPSGTQAAFLQTTGSCEQSFDVAKAGAYTVSWQGSVRPWIDTAHDYEVLVDGRRILYVDSATLNPYKYMPLSATVDLAVGTHTLRFAGLNSRGGDHTSFVDSISVKSADATISVKNSGYDDIAYAAGTYITRPPAVTTPFARLTNAKVTTSGRCIYGEFAAIPDGSYLAMESVATQPTVWVNGRAVGQTTMAVFTPDHHGFILFLPDSVTIAAGDTMSLVAPMAWANVKNDFAEPLPRTPVQVNAGRSWIVTDTFRPSLKVGMNFGHQQVPTYGMYSVTRNLRVRGTNWGQGVTGYNADGYPIRLDRDTVATTLVDDRNANSIDGTGMPTPEGLYAVGWGRNAPSLVDCSLASDNATVAERVDLANPGGADGRGRVRVFDFKRASGATATNFTVKLVVTDTTRAPSFSSLVVYGPGDFEAIAPVTLAGIDDPAYPSAMFLARTASGLGGMRFTDGVIGYDNADNACEPEHIMPETQCQWNGWKRSSQVKFRQARPWSSGTSPYCYSPLFGEQYTATLGSTLDAPAAGTNQVVQVPDAATAPILEGLVLQSGAERMRVMAVDGSTVTIERGSESTVPQARGGGPIAVSGRHPLPDLAAFGAANIQVIELVSTSPHKYRTGNHAHLDGGVWAPWTMADGSKSNGNYSLNYYVLGALVTGPNTIVIQTKGPNKPNTTLAAPVDLDPEHHYTWMTMPGSPHLPYSVQARVAAAAHSDLHVNFPYAASDSFVDAVARIVLANYPKGRRVYTEYINEPWNWAYPTSHTQATWCWMQDRQYEGAMTWVVRRGGQIARRFKAHFDAAGRGDEVRSIFNMQQGYTSRIRTAAIQCLSEGLPVPDMAIAPYIDIGNQPSLVKGMESGGIDRAVDLWTWNFAYGMTAGTSGPMPYCEGHRKAVDAVNAEFGLALESYGYEGNAEITWPVVTTTLSSDVAATAASMGVADASRFVAGQMVRVGPEWVKIRSVSGNTLAVDRGQAGTTAAACKAGAQVRNAYMESSRDLTYSPVFRQSEQDIFALWQRYFHRYLPNGYAVIWASGYKQWGYYHWFNQLPGRGDGRDGRAVNGECMATPGLPHTKRPDQNQDLHNVSPRGQALLEWNHRVNNP